MRFTKPALPPWEQVEPQLRAAYSDGMLCHGHYAVRLEQALALECSASVAVCSNATTGLMLLLAGLRKPGEVILPAFTFSATLQAVEWAGLTPVLVDVRDDCNIDPNAVRAAITPQTVAILGVHISGIPCDVRALERIAERAQIELYFDGAHALGGRVNDVPLPSLGHACVLSMGATKLLAVGEGGAIVSRNGELINRMKLAINHGHGAGELDYRVKGFNARLQEFDAIIGLAGMDSIAWQVERRNAIRRLYMERLQGLPITWPEPPAGAVVPWKDISCFMPCAQGIATRLAGKGIPTKQYYPALNRLERWEACGGRVGPGSVKHAERLSERVLSLPCYSTMTDDEVHHVAAGIREVFA